VNNVGYRRSVKRQARAEAKLARLKVKDAKSDSRSYRSQAKSEAQLAELRADEAKAEALADAPLWKQPTVGALIQTAIRRRRERREQQQ
jgi:hypothetical protein